VKGNTTFERIDVMNLPELPKGWVWVKLGEIAEIVSGYGFPKKLQGKRNGEVPFFKVLDISKTVLSGGIFLRNADNYISKKECHTIRAEPLKKGTIVFAKIGEAIKLNRRAILDQESLVDNNVMGIYPYFQIVNNLFVYYFFLTIKLEKYSRATTVPSVRKNDVMEIPIPLPPLAEQKRIVEKIEELFTRLEAGVEALKKVKAQIRRYRQAVLKYAFEGKLSEEWRKHVGADHGVGPEYIKKGKHIGSSLQNDLPPLPEGWVWVRLVEVAGEVEMVNPKKNPDKEFLYIDIAAIDNEKQSIVNTKIYSGKNAPSRARQLVKSGDILFSTVRTYLKNIAIVNEAYDGQIASTGFCVIRPNTNINSRFIFWYVQTDDFLNPLNQLQRGTNYPAVRDSDVFEQPLPLPPLPEQRQIVSEIERRFSVADEVEKVVDQSLKQAERLKQSILKRAFEGKLVPQDPEDEPAERIKDKTKE
jgi:type I restriction enzyme S subunit